MRVRMSLTCRQCIWYFCAICNEWQRRKVRTCGKFKELEIGQAMKIVWERKRERRLLDQPKEAVKTLGHNAASKLVKCVEEIGAAPNFNRLVARRPFGLHRLRHRREGQWAMSLDRRLRLIIKPDSTYSVTIIVEIVDYH